jgi:hypothetical protein
MARPHGSINRHKAAGSDFARRIVEDPIYLANLLQRAQAGTLPPAVEQLILYYAFGRPVEHVITDMTVRPASLEDLSPQELALRAERLTKQLRGEVDDPIEVEVDDEPDDVH